MRHSAKVAWRALALLQREMDLENDKNTFTPMILDIPGMKKKETQ